MNTLNNVIKEIEYLLSDVLAETNKEYPDSFKTKLTVIAHKLNSSPLINDCDEKKELVALLIALADKTKEYADCSTDVQDANANLCNADTEEEEEEENINVEIAENAFQNCMWETQQAIQDSRDILESLIKKAA